MGGKTAAGGEDLPAEFPAVQPGKRLEPCRRFPVPVGCGRRPEDYGVGEDSRQQESCQRRVGQDSLFPVERSHYGTGAAHGHHQERDGLAGRRIAELVVVDDLEYFQAVGSGHRLAELVVVNQDECVRKGFEKRRLGCDAGQRAILFHGDHRGLPPLDQLEPQVFQRFSDADAGELRFNERREGRGQPGLGSRGGSVAWSGKDGHPLFPCPVQERLGHLQPSGHDQDAHPDIDCSLLDGTAVTGHDQEGSRIMTRDPAGEGFLGHGSDEEVKALRGTARDTGEKRPFQTEGKVFQRRFDRPAPCSPCDEILLGQLQQRYQSARHVAAVDHGQHTDIVPVEQLQRFLERHIDGRSDRLRIDDIAHLGVDVSQIHRMTDAEAFKYVAGLRIGGSRHCGNDIVMSQPFLQFRIAYGRGNGISVRVPVADNVYFLSHSSLPIKPDRPSNRSLAGKNIQQGLLVPAPELNSAASPGRSQPFLRQCIVPGGMVFFP